MIVANIGDLLVRALTPADSPVAFERDIYSEIKTAHSILLYSGKNLGSDIHPLFILKVLKVLISWDLFLMITIRQTGKMKG